MGFVKKAAKKTARKAGAKVAHTVRGGCPGSSNGKHSYKTKLVGGSPVTWCHNAGCGRVG